MKTTMKGLFNNLGFDVSRYRPNENARRCTLNGTLSVAKAVGFIPDTVFDVGASRGPWSLEAVKVFESARYVLIDPLQENEADLRRACHAIGNAEYRLAVAMEEPGTATINVHPDLDGSSIFLEREANINGAPRQVTAVSVDALREEMDLLHPFLIKIDAQGAEMEVLAGAQTTLPMTEMIIVEVLLFDFFQGKNPQLFDMVTYLHVQGFVVWDIFGMGYRLIDRALSQVDMVFVKENGLFRQTHQYATEEQRRKNTQVPEKRNV